MGSVTWNGGGGLTPAPIDADSPQVAAKKIRERLENPDAVLSRGDLAELGWPRRGVDTIFRRLPVVALPGYTRPFVRVADYLALIADCTFTGDRVRP